MGYRVDRSVQHNLQHVVGALGQVQSYLHSTDRHHRSVGWYVTPGPAEPGCACPYCQAAGANADLYLGYNMRDAIVEAGVAARAHEAAAA